MGRMFSRVVQTWNPITGCRHGCTYCFARRLAETRLRHTRKYGLVGFTPAFHPQELQRGFRRGGLVFVCDMGDMLGSWVPRDWIERVLNVIRRNPNIEFLLLTKNPARYHELELPENVVAGATVETDLDGLYAEHRISEAPPPSERLEAMRRLRHPKKMVSIEPILDFSPAFPERIASISPLFVYVGYDNWNARLPEPPLEKTKSLIRELEARGIPVHVKTLREPWTRKYKRGEYKP